MRHTKYRAWDNVLKQMHYVVEHWDAYNPLLQNEDGRPYEPSFSDAILDDRFELMESIGRQYADGQMMFEGDLVQDGHWVGVIKFSTEDGRASFVICFRNKTINSYFPDDLKKIGTVYENPDLAAQLDLKGLI